MLTKMKMPIVTMGQAKTMFFSLTIAAISLACKNEKNPDPEPVPIEKAIIPSKDKSYYYRVTDTEGAASGLITKVTSVRDSAGLSVSHLANITKEGDQVVTFEYKAYSKNGVTTNEIGTPSAFINLLNELKDVANIVDLKMSGFPLYQKMENKGSVNSVMSFDGGPVKVYIKLEIPTEEGDVAGAEIESKVVHKPGKVVKEETISTVAGTFACSKWEYIYEAENKITYSGGPSETSKDVTNVTVWTAPGIGIVKSIEQSEDGTSTTELEKIEKQ